MIYTGEPKSVVLVMSNQNRDTCRMSDGISWGIFGRLLVRSQEKEEGGIEDAAMMNASVACREDGESDEPKKPKMTMPSERKGQEGNPHLDP